MSLSQAHDTKSVPFSKAHARFSSCDRVGHNTPTKLSLSLSGAPFPAHTSGRRPSNPRMACRRALYLVTRTRAALCCYRSTVLGSKSVRGHDFCIVCSGARVLSPISHQVLESSVAASRENSKFLFHHTNNEIAVASHRFSNAIHRSARVLSSIEIASTPNILLCLSVRLQQRNAFIYSEISPSRLHARCDDWTGFA